MIQVCSRCLYPANHPLGIRFDAEGVCTGCRVHEEKDRLDWVERERRLAHLLDGYRGRTRGRHDCVVPISGGRDSFFIVHLVRKVYRLNPLLVVYNRHYNTRGGIYNIARLRTVFGCDIVTLTLAPELVQRVMRATLSISGSFHWHALAGHTAFPVQTAVRMKIPLVIWGAHQGLEQVGMFSHLDEVEMTRRYRREHDLMGTEAEEVVDKHGLNESDIHPYFYPEDADLRRTGVRGIYLGNYHRWDSKAQHEQMVDLYDYYLGPLARTFDTYNDVDDLHYAGFHDIIKVHKHGYGKALDHACREIRFGRLTRDEGQSLVQKYQSAPAPNTNELTQLIKMSEFEMLALVDRHRNSKLDTSKGNGAPLPGYEPKNEVTLRSSSRCIFRTRMPADMEGPAMTEQLLTRGFALE